MKQLIKIFDNDGKHYDIPMKMFNEIRKQAIESYKIKTKVKKKMDKPKRYDKEYTQGELSCIRLMEELGFSIERIAKVMNRTTEGIKYTQQYPHLALKD